MTINTQDAIQAIRQIEPTTMAARLRPLMGEIDRKLAEGVRLVVIRATLARLGLDVPLPTLRAYVSRYRSTVPGTGQAARLGQAAVEASVPATNVPPLPSAASSPAEPPPSAMASQLEQASPSSASEVGSEPVSMLEFERLLRPDPQKYAADMARYEAAGQRLKRRSRGREPP